MAILDRLRKKKSAGKDMPSLAEDIPKASEWLVQAMASSGYVLDGTLKSFWELDRFYDEQQRPGGLLEGKAGDKLFAIGCYMGQVLIAELGGSWETDDSDPMGEVNIAVRFSDGSLCCPVQRAMKRGKNGGEDSLYAYGYVISQQVKNNNEA